MRRFLFHRLDGFHGVRPHLPASLAAILTIVAPFVLLFVVWLAMCQIVAWMWSILPPPLAWGNWPLRG